MSGPAFSLLATASDPTDRCLRELAASVVAQTFQDWELLVVVGRSSAPDLSAVMADLAASDPRITVVPGDEDAPSVLAAHALSLASGTYVASVGACGRLAPDSLARCAAVLADPEVDLVYTDEDRRTSVSVLALRKPDWSPERLRSQMYTAHLAVMRRGLVVEVGGYRPGFEGAEDYDLVLRVGEQARRVVHIPEVLYHSQPDPDPAGSAAPPAVAGTTAPPAVAGGAGSRRAVEEHLVRRGISGRVEVGGPGGTHRIHRTVVGHPLVSVVIPTRGSVGEVGGHPRVFVTELLRSVLQRTTWARWEVVVVADATTPASTIDELCALAGDRITVVPFDEPFNFARKINLGAVAASGDHLVLLNDDIEVVTPDWIETMLALGQQPDVGMVGPLLTFEDGTIQHAGLTFRWMTPGNIGYGAALDTGPMCGYAVEREVSGVTAACCMLPAAVFHEVGGMSEQFAVNYNDVDLSFKVRGTGRRILWTPHAQLRHFESKSRTGGVGASEISLILSRWGRLYEREDPYWPMDPVASG